MSLIPNQPYPDSPVWEDLSPTLINGWGVPGILQSLQAIVEKNSVTIFGGVQIGTSHIMAPLENRFRPILPISVQALILGGPTCLVELQGNETTGGRQLVLSAFSLGMTNEQMIATYGGMYLSIFGSYPRRTP